VIDVENKEQVKGHIYFISLKLALHRKVQQLKAVYFKKT